MSAIRFIEDLFLDLAINIQNNQILVVNLHDFKIIHDFEDCIITNRGFTKKQADYAIKLLKKYKESFDEDISQYLDNAVWKKPFRVIDYTKKISIEKSKDGHKTLHIKFPFTLKDAYVKEFSNSNNRIPSSWDPDLKVQVADLFSINLIQLFEFGKKYHFDFSDDFLEAVSLTEEFWSNEQSFSPHSILNDDVELINASESAVKYFSENKTGNNIKDLFLARLMGFPISFTTTPTTHIERIISSNESHFWIKDLSSVLTMISDLDHWPVVIVLDRSSNVIEWSHRLVAEYKKLSLPTDDIKICFRFKNDDPKNKEFNNWIKENNLGGGMKTGKIFVCQHKPPKWMLNDNFDAKIIISNSLYPHTSSSTTSMIQTHHTVIYVGNIKPSPYKEKKIVEL